MATIGLDKLYDTTITSPVGDETYANPAPLAKAISAELSGEVAEVILYADDSPSEVAKEFKSGKLTLGVESIEPTNVATIIGVRTDNNGVLILASKGIHTVLGAPR